MTTTSIYRYGVAAPILCLLLFCFCSRLGESTDLGSGIIEDVDPGRTDIDKHFKGFSLDTSSFKGSFSVPAAGDTGFGYHLLSTSGNFFLGKANKERSAGYFEIVVLRDSLASKRVLLVGDTLKSFKLLFTGVFPKAQLFDLYTVGSKSKALVPSAGQKLGTISFNARGDTTQIDTFDLFNSVDATLFARALCDTVFKACSSATFDTTAAAKRKDTLRFAIINNDTVVQLKSSCSMIISARRPGTDTSLKVKTLTSSQAWYVVAEDDDPAALSKLPISNFASKRTAVYKFDIHALWWEMDSTSKLITAGFAIPNEVSGGVSIDTLTARCIVRADTVHDGVKLDSLFNVDGRDISVQKGRSVISNFTTCLQDMFKNGSNPPYFVFLYIRYINTTSEWKTVSIDLKPSFSAIITQP